MPLENVDTRWVQRFSNYRKALSRLRQFIEKAFKVGLISEGQSWMDMLESRNKTAHSYNEETADEIAATIFSTDYDLFCHFEIKMEELRSGSQPQLFDKK